MPAQRYVVSLEPRTWFTLLLPISRMFSVPLAQMQAFIPATFQLYLLIWASLRARV